MPDIYEVSLIRRRGGNGPILEERLEGDAAAVAEWCRAIAHELGPTPPGMEGCHPECVLLHPHRGPAILGSTVSTKEHHHRLVQHRDGRPPWCPSCRRTASGKIVEKLPEEEAHGTRAQSLTPPGAAVGAAVPPRPRS